jgi:hypothetical protein
MLEFLNVAIESYRVYMCNYALLIQFVFPFGLWWSLLVSHPLFVPYRLECLFSSSPLRGVIWRWSSCSWIEAPTRMLRAR